MSSDYKKLYEELAAEHVALDHERKLQDEHLRRMGERVVALEQQNTKLLEPLPPMPRVIVSAPMELRIVPMVDAPPASDKAQ